MMDARIHMRAEGRRQATTRSRATKRETGRTQSGRFTELDPDKLRGGYYTSPEVAAWLAAWAIRLPGDAVLEPSCGDGVFLKAAADRLASLGLRGPAIANRLTGVEILSTAADRARDCLRESLGLFATGTVTVGDFFEWWQQPSRPLFDAVIGNPPFIRYQTFPEPHRSRAMSIMAGLGLTPNKLTNIWVPFVIASAAALRAGGRLALVLPAELLQVSYASQLRSFLTDRFARIDIVACNELFFDNAEQEVLLLLTDGAVGRPSAANTSRVAMTEARTVAEIVQRPPTDVLSGAVPKTIHHDSEKWLKYFLTECEIAFMRALRDGTSTTTLRAHAHVDVGVVTGKNQFFVLNAEQVDRFGLAEYTMPLVSRSVQLRGARIDAADWRALAVGDDRVHLLHLAPLNGSRLSGSLARYVRTGEEGDVHRGYKCSIRSPWYAVPSVWTPHCFMFRQIYDFPRVVLNQASATSTDTIHRMTCKSPADAVAAHVYTHLTAASAEIEGRSYGGGVLELEPTEAERLLMPAQLAKALPISECDRLIRAGRLDDVLAENDQLVLRDGMGLSKSDCILLRGIWNRMRERRTARRRRPRREVGDDGG